MLLGAAYNSGSKSIAVRKHVFRFLVTALPRMATRDGAEFARRDGHALIVFPHGLFMGAGYYKFKKHYPNKLANQDSDA